MSGCRRESIEWLSSTTPSSLRDVEAAIVCELVDLLKVDVLLVDDNHAASGPPAGLSDEAFQV
jgi:hypothetical protein